MVSENNLPPLENKKPFETVYELKETDYKIKTSQLSPAARSKIIKKYGSDYLSDRVFINDIALMQMYGPGWGEWAAKFAITTTAGIVLGPAAIPVGAAVWGGSKIAEECFDNEEDKKVFRFISDCSGSVAIGGVVGGAVEAVGGVVGAASFKGAAGVAARNTDKVVGKAVGQWAAEEIAKGGSKAAYSAFARETTRIMAENSGRMITEVGREVGKAGFGAIETLISSGLIPAWEAKIHVEHVEKGINYKRGCPVCDA